MIFDRTEMELLAKIMLAGLEAIKAPEPMDPYRHTLEGEWAVGEVLVTIERALKTGADGITLSIVTNNGTRL